VTVNATCGAGSASLDIQGVDIVTAGHAPGYVALLYDPTTSGKVNQRHVINNPQAVLMLLRKQINARRLAVLKARAPAIDRGDDELAA
jgi:hypothetical protein